MGTAGLLVLFLMTILHIESTTFSPTTMVGLVSSIQHHYHCGCITLVPSSVELTAKHYLLQALKVLSNLPVPTPITILGPDVQELLPCARSEALTVFLGPRDGIQNSSKLLESSTRWLFLLDNVSAIEGAFDGIKMPFDNEVLVATQLSGSDIALTEVFRNNPNQPVRDQTWGSWHVQKGLHAPLDSFYARRGGLHGATLRVVVAQYAPITIVKQVEGEIVDVGGYMGQVWHLMEHQMNCRTQFLGPSDGKWGFQLTNGSWNGIIGMVSQGDVDLALNGYTMTEERTKVVAYSPVVLYDRYYLMIQQPSAKSAGWNNFLTPFNPNLWFAILASILVLGTTLAMLCRVISQYNGVDHHYSLSRTLYYVYGIFCQQGHDITPNSMSGRLIYWFSYLTSLVIQTAYASKLISFLAVQKYNLPFTSFEGAVEDGRYKVGIAAKSSFYYIFQTTVNPVMHQVFVQLVEQEDQLPTSPIEGLQRLCKDRTYAFFISMNVASGLQNDLSCRVVHIPSASANGPVAWLLPKTSPFKKLIAKSLLHLHRAGLLQALHARVWPVYDLSPPQDNVYVSLGDAAPLLALLSIGVVAAILMLLAEYLVHHKQCNTLHSFFRCGKILIPRGMKRGASINS